jgi:beta-glucosidase
MKWLCSVGVAVSLALQPALADDLFGNHPLTPKRGMRLSRNCSRK